MSGRKNTESLQTTSAAMDGIRVAEEIAKEYKNREDITFKALEIIKESNKGE